MAVGSKVGHVVIQTADVGLDSHTLHEQHPPKHFLGVLGLFFGDWGLRSRKGWEGVLQWQIELFGWGDLDVKGAWDKLEFMEVESEGWWERICLPHSAFLFSVAQPWAKAKFGRLVVSEFVEQTIEYADAVQISELFLVRVEVHILAMALRIPSLNLLSMRWLHSARPMFSSISLRFCISSILLA